MHYAIIAAGEGSRLRSAGINIPKPLIKLNGTPLIERLIQIMLNNNAESISIIVNEIYPELREWTESFHCPVNLNIVLKTTPSSMHSLYALRHSLQSKSFILTTVDTIFKEEEFKSFLNFIRINVLNDAIMAVTSFVEDEKPLWVKTDSENNIISFDSERNEHQYVSGGFYYFTPSVMTLLPDAIKDGMHKMRNFQSLLVKNGLRVKAYEFNKIVDVDHLSDLQLAEKFLVE